MKVQVFSFNMIFSHLRGVFLERVIRFGETLGDQVKGRSPKKQKSLIEVPKARVRFPKKLKFFVEFPNLVPVKVPVRIFIMNFISPPQRVLTPSSPFRRNFVE